MRRAGDLIKKQIVQVDTGNIVGHVEDLLLDPDHNCLAGLITTTARWLREAHIIPWSTIVVNTGDVILVQSGVEPAPIHDFPDLLELSLRKIHVSGTTVVTRSGKKVGSIAEVLISPDGHIHGYSVSTGLFNAEKQFVAVKDVEVLGSDAVIIKDDSLHDTLDVAASQATPKTRVVLPFTGTPIVVEEPQPEHPAHADPRTDIAAVELGEELMHLHDVHRDKPPVTDQPSAAEDEARVAEIPAEPTEQPAVVEPTQDDLAAPTEQPDVIEPTLNDPEAPNEPTQDRTGV